MKHKAIVDAFDAIHYGNPFTTQMKLDWVNELEAIIHHRLKKPVTATAVTGVAGTASYNLPSGTNFVHIETLHVDGMPYPRVDASLPNTTGFYDAGSSKVGLYPVPAGGEAIAIISTAPYAPSTTGTYNTVDTTAESPFDAMYLTYLQSKSEFMLRQYASYNNIAAAFNAQFEDYVSWWNERNPFSRRDAKCYRLPVIQSELPQNTKTK